MRELMHVCVCVCVCVRARARTRAKQLKLGPWFALVQEPVQFGPPRNFFRAEAAPTVYIAMQVHN